MARSGQAWPGVARSGQEWAGVGRGRGWPGVVRSGQEWPGPARRGQEWPGMARSGPGARSDMKLFRLARGNFIVAGRKAANMRLGCMDVNAIAQPFP